MNSKNLIKNVFQNLNTKSFALFLGLSTLFMAPLSFADVICAGETAQGSVYTLRLYTDPSAARGINHQVLSYDVYIYRDGTVNENGHYNRDPATIYTVTTQEVTEETPMAVQVSSFKEQLKIESLEEDRIEMNFKSHRSTQSARAVRLDYIGIDYSANRGGLVVRSEEDLLKELVHNEESREKINQTQLYITDEAANFRGRFKDAVCAVL